MTSTDMLVRTIRVRNRHEPGVFGRLATAIGDQDGMLGTISTVALTSQYTIRDLDVLVDDEAHLHRVLNAIAALPDSQVLEVRDEVLAAHRGGKTRTVSRRPVSSLAELRKVYTPGVAEVCQRLHEEPDLAYLYTGIGQSVAIVTDGTAILGLGNVGPVAGLPVMEGKAALLHELEIRNWRFSQVRLRARLINVLRDAHLKIAHELRHGQLSLARKEIVSIINVLHFGRDERAADGPPECAWCPLCRAIRLSRQSGPGLAGHMSGAADALATAAQQDG